MCDNRRSDDAAFIWLHLNKHVLNPKCENKDYIALHVFKNNIGGGFKGLVVLRFGYRPRALVNICIESPIRGYCSVFLALSRSTRQPLNTTRCLVLTVVVFCRITNHPDFKVILTTDFVLDHATEWLPVCLLHGVTIQLLFAPSYLSCFRVVLVKVKTRA